MNNNNLFFHASIYLKGDNLEPAKLTSLLGITPSFSHSKGKRWHTSAGSEVVERTGLWAVTIKSETQIELTEALETLSRQLSANNHIITEMPGIEEAYLDVFIAAHTDANGECDCEFSLNEKSLSAIGKLGLPMKFTVTVSPADIA